MLKQTIKLGSISLGILLTAISSNFSLPVKAMENQNIFSCNKSSQGYATVAIKKNGELTSPLITWNSQEFGDKYNPAYRCQEVTRRLNQAVSDNDGTLSGLLLTLGKLGSNRRYWVVCYVNSLNASCNDQNILITLSPKNERDPQKILSSLINFGVSATTDPIAESSGQPYIDLAKTLNSLGVRDLPQSQAKLTN